VDIPASNLKRAITKILYEQHYIDKYSEMSTDAQGTIRIYLRYYNGKPVLSGLKRISVPGRRVYVGAFQLPRVLNGLGVAIISTNKGVMTDQDARRLKVGGEIICYIW
ncbi:MAG: 30S ribosomal protein S8, partial [Bacteroidetes bacterium]|nr:30S ribosomal protein S8 [Bacteroidota bacterium]